MIARTSDPARLGRQGRGRRLLRAGVYGVVFALPVSVLALVVREKSAPILDLDATIIRHTTDYTREHPGLRTALIVWQEAFQPWRVYVVGTAVCLWAWLRTRETTRSAWAFGTMMVTWNLALVLKLLVERARPVVENPVSTAPGWSFPSGHAANTAGAVTVLTLLLWPTLGPTGRRVAPVAAAAVAACTALDRVFLGVHYPSDVLAGILVGCGIAVASYAGYQGWNPVAPANVGQAGPDAAPEAVRAPAHPTSH